MKCNKCSEEWNVDPSRSALIKVCPFCQEKIVTEESNEWKSFDKTRDLLVYIAMEYGTDALFTKKHLSDHISPMLHPGQKKLVMEAFSCGAVKDLQENMAANRQDKEIAVKQAVKKLTDLLYTKEACEKLIWEFTYAVGWGLTEPQDSSSVQENIPSSENSHSEKEEKTLEVLELGNKQLSEIRNLNESAEKNLNQIEKQDVEIKRLIKSVEQVRDHPKAERKENQGELKKDIVRSEQVQSGLLLGNRYEILSHIGSGSIADVYKGKDQKLNRFIAIKVLKSDYSTDETSTKKFLSEAKAVAGLMHPNVVNVYDVNQDRGLYYMVMEWVEGITLKYYIQRKGRLSFKETISISIQMVNGIQAAHDKNIIHRDIKPQNVLISKDGKVKVTDFGIATDIASAHKESSNVMESVRYISPEHARGAVVNEMSDIYSVGITMYKMVTGLVPFDGDSTITVAWKHLQEEMISPKNHVPDIPRSLECIIMKCTEKEQKHRYQDCQSLSEDLRRSLVDPDRDFVEIESVSAESSEGTEESSGRKELSEREKERLFSKLRTTPFGYVLQLCIMCTFLYISYSTEITHNIIAHERFACGMCVCHLYILLPMIILMSAMVMISGFFIRDRLLPALSNEIYKKARNIFIIALYLLYLPILGMVVNAHTFAVPAALAFLLLCICLAGFYLLRWMEN